MKRHKATRPATTVAEVRRLVARWKRAGKSVGLVPTMGALHEGHVSLIRRSAGENDRTIVSIFVNPKQFGPKEDFNKYPRRLARDRRLCAAAGADVVFAPPVAELYPDGFTTYVEVEGLTKGLCGASRPGHFRGVTTICAKLFLITSCDRAYFGEKDYQQLTVIRSMVRDLDMDLEIVPCPTVRLSDGLAMSSRNRYLKRRERRQALVLYRALKQAKQLVEAEGVTRSSDLAAAMRKIINAAPAARIDYIAVVHPETLAPLEVITDEARIALAVFIGATRLIDNIKVNTKGVTASA